MLLQNLSPQNGRSLWSPDLPPEIIHHILSFLPSTREAAKTCTLSKCWLHAWRSYFEGPFLIFINREHDDPRKILQFHNFVQHTMSRFDNRNRHIQKFVYDVSDIVETDPSLNKWINIAIDNNVQEMTLSKIQFSFGFLERVLNNASLRCLNLDLWASLADIQDNINYYSINLPNLVTLTLSTHYFHGELLERFLKGCPFLETLTIGSCNNPASEIKLTGSDHLKTVDLRLQYPKSVHIDAPNLETLHCNMNKIGEQSVLSIDNPTKLKHLDLEFLTLDTGWFEGFVSQLVSLETLKLKFENSSSSKGVFTISNPSIKNMVLNRCMSPRRPLVIVDVLKLSYFWYVGCMNLYSPHSGVFVYPPRDCIAHLTLMLNCRLFNWLGKLYETISLYSNNLRSLSLVYCGKGYHEIGSWWEDTSLRSTAVIETEHMKLTIDDELHSDLFFTNFNKLVSGLFSICHPAIITIEANSGNDSGEITRNDLKLLGMDVMLEDQDNEVECVMCSIVVNKCWKHQLKEVKIKEDEFVLKEKSAVKISFMLKW